MKKTVKTLLKAMSLTLVALMLLSALSACGKTPAGNDAVTTDGVTTEEVDTDTSAASVNGVPLDQFVIVYSSKKGYTEADATIIKTAILNSKVTARSPDLNSIAISYGYAVFKIKL